MAVWYRRSGFVEDRQRAGFDDADLLPQIRRDGQPGERKPGLHRAVIKPDPEEPPQRRGAPLPRDLQKRREGRKMLLPETLFRVRGGREDVGRKTQRARIFLDLVRAGRSDKAARPELPGPFQFPRRAAFTPEVASK